MKKIFLGISTLILLLFAFSFPQKIFAVDGEVTYTGTDTNLSGDDIAAGPFNLGFTFSFYGTDFTQAWVNINGTLNFSGSYNRYSNVPLSTALSGTNIADNSIYAFWDDLNTNASGQSGNKNIYYATVGSSPDRMFVSQWTNIYFHGTTVQMGTFQVILYESTNIIQIQYRDLLGNASQPNREKGNSATIGIRKDNNAYSQYSHNTASLTQEQAIRYTPSGENTYTVDTDADYELVYLAPVGAPTSPTLVTPTDNSTNVTTTPAFEWLPVDGATSYRILISTVSNFSTTVADQTTSDVAYTHNNPLNTSTQYYWRVQSINSNGSSLSPTRSFTTAASANTNPDTPTDVVSEILASGNPVMNLNGAELTATLTDDDADEQIRYRLQIATDESFNSLAIDYRSPFGNTGSASFIYGQTTGTYLVGTSSAILDTGDYYLRIRAEDDAAASSSWYTISGIAFSIADDIEAPLISNIESSFSTNSITITWETNELSTSQVEYGLVNSYGHETTESDISPMVTSHSVTINDAKSCARYFYRVKSSDAADNESTSSQQIITTTGCEASEIERGEEAKIETTGGEIELINENSTAKIIVPADFSNEGASFQINLLNQTDSPESPNNTALIAGNFFDLLAITDSGEQLSSFDEPVTFIIEYGEDVQESFIEDTLDIYRYEDGTWTKLNCLLDINANTITCTLNGFSVYGLFGEALGESTTQNTSHSSKSSSDNSSCSAIKPSSPPELFQIDMTNDTATLFFVPADGQVSGYIIKYGTTPEANHHSVAFDNNDKSGAVKFTINSLYTAENWYFRVAAKNDCAVGDFSQIKNAKIQNFQSNNAITKEVTVSPKKDEKIAENKKTTPAPTKAVQKTTTLNDKKYTVSVKIVNNGKPIDGASVEIKSGNQKAVTNKDGIAIFENIANGLHTFKIVNDAYAAEEDIMVEGDNQQFDISISLEMNNELLPTSAWIGIIAALIIIFFFALRFSNRKSNR